MHHFCRWRMDFPGLYLLLIATIVGVAGKSTWAQQTMEPLHIHQTASEAIDIHRKTQQAEDNWAAEKMDLRGRYHALLAQEKALEAQHAALQSQVVALKAHRAETKRAITEAAQVSQRLQAHLDALVVRLQEHITRDLPFLPLERSQRMEEIRKTLSQPDTSFAERFRRVMEAVKIETEYGQSVEVYPQTLSIDDQGQSHAITADILRVGRLALFWRSPDGKRVGQWDRVTGKWTLLPDTYRHGINEAMEMALKRRTVDMVKLPLGRIAKK